MALPIPEFHDIGKLVDMDLLKALISEREGYPSNKLSFGHDFVLRLDDKEQPYDFRKVFGIYEPDNPTWKCVRLHHKDIWDLDVGLLRIADRMASSFSRLLTDKEKRELQTRAVKAVTHKLWNPSFRKEGLNLLVSMNKIQDLIRLVEKQDVENFMRSYKSLLNARPEDFSPPNNLVSLYTHLILVGKFYRVLESSVRAEGASLLSFEGAKANSIRDAENNWQVKLVRCKVGFPQRSIKVKDLNIFSILKEKMDRLRKSDQAFPFSSDEFLMVLPSKCDLHGILKMFTEDGFHIEITSVGTSIEKLEPDPKSMIRKELEELKKRTDKIKRRMEIPEERQKQLIAREQEESYKKFQETRSYWDLSDEIEPLICEVCQMERAETTWVDEGSGVVEHLCQRCSEIRNYGEGLRKLASWTYEENIQVCWLKIRLMFDELLRILESLYLEYLKNLGIKDSQPDVRFSLLEEFHQDFEAFLSDFNEDLTQQFSEQNIEHPLDDLFVIKIERLSSIMRILESFNRFIDHYFPEFKRTRKSPIKLSITCSNVKFPFFEHWRILNSADGDIVVTIIGRGRLVTSIDMIDEVLTKAKIPNKTLLHRLVNVANVSETLAKVELYEHERVLNLPAGLDFESIITLSKILEE